MTRSELVNNLRELANDMEHAANEQLDKYGRSCILEYQMERRDIGYEPRLLRKAADELERDRRIPHD